MTTVTLRPSGSDLIGGNVVPPGDVDDALSDDTDATYVNILQARLRWTTFALPAGVYVKSSTFRLRGQRDPGWPSPYAGARVTTWAVDAFGVGAIVQDATFNIYPDPIADYSAQPAAWPLGFSQQTYIDNVFVDIAANVPNVTECYLDITYAVPPTVTVSNPTGTITDTSSPTARWVHVAGSDGGPQARAQVRVFSAAEYGIAGFEPALSPATFEALIYGPDSSVRVGPLADATTYRAYVRTAQSVNGEPQWSAWDFEAFTTDFDLPEIVEVITYPVDALGRIELTVLHDDTTPDWESVTVQRSDDAGATWVFVRGGTGSERLFGDVWAGFDYEAPNGVAVLYRARAAVPEFVGPWTYSDSASWSAARVDWLKDPLLPSRNVEVIVNQIPQLAFPRRRGVHPVIGRARPVTVSDVRGSAVGTITLVTLDDDTADALELILSTSVLLLQTPATDRWGSRYISIGEIGEPRVVNLENYSERYWTLPFVEVDAPADSVSWADADQVDSLLFDDAGEILTTDEGAALYVEGLV